MALGTSLPELATSLVAARRGQSSLAVGNVIGSNIINIYLVAGLASVVAPVDVEPATRAFDLPALVALGFVFLFMLTGRRMTREHGFALAVAYGVILWTSHSVHSAR